VCKSIEAYRLERKYLYRVDIDFFQKVAFVVLQPFLMPHMIPSLV